MLFKVLRLVAVVFAFVAGVGGRRVVLVVVVPVVRNEVNFGRWRDNRPQGGLLGRVVRIIWTGSVLGSWLLVVRTIVKAARCAAVVLAHPAKSEACWQIPMPCSFGALKLGLVGCLTRKD